MGYIIDNGKIAKAKKVTLSVTEKNAILTPSEKQKAIKENILKRKAAFFS